MCVLSPLLFILYTSDCRSEHPDCQLFKYAADTALVAKCANDDSPYRAETSRFVEWCRDNFLELNVGKTKEMITDFRISEVQHQPYLINNEPVETVHNYKCLGTVMSSELWLSGRLRLPSKHQPINKSYFHYIQGLKMCKSIPPRAPAAIGIALELRADTFENS